MAWPSAAFSSDGELIWYIVAPAPVADERCLRRHGDEAAAAVVEQHGADDARAGREKIEAAGFFEHRHVRLLEDPVAEVRHDLDAGEIALVHRAVEALAGERLLVDRAVGVAVEQAADAVFELDDPVGRIVHQRPGELLIIEKLAALDRVVEMFVERVGRVEDAVVAALDHPRAARLADEAFHRDDDAGPRVGGGDMQRGEHAGAAGAEDEDVGSEFVDGEHHVRTDRVLWLVD